MPLEVRSGTGMLSLFFTFYWLKNVLGAQNPCFHHASFITRCTRFGQCFFLFCLFQQVVSSLNSGCLFSAPCIEPSSFYMFNKYLLNKWMDVCKDDFFWASAHHLVHVVKSPNIISSYFKTDSKIITHTCKHIYRTMIFLDPPFVTILLPLIAQLV